jgi:hypothetical protein
MSPKPATPAAETWRNRITRHADVRPAELVPNPANWRTHPRWQQRALAGALGEVGWVAQVMVNTTTGQVVDGHLRLELALSRGEPTVPVAYVELSEEEERLVLATLDPIGALAWQPVPLGIVTTGGYALVMRGLRPAGDDWLDLAAYDVGIGPRQGTPLVDYLRGRVDKACATLGSTPRAPQPVPLVARAELVPPYAVVLRTGPTTGAI